MYALSVFLAVAVGGDNNGSVQSIHNSPIPIERASHKDSDTVVEGIGGMGNEDYKLDNAEIGWWR